MVNTKHLLFFKYLWEDFSLCISSDLKIPLCGSTFLQEIMFDQALICTTYAFTQISAYLADCISSRIFSIFLYKNLTSSHCCPTLPLSYDLNKLNSTCLHEDAFTQVWVFLAFGSWKEDLKEFLYIFLSQTSSPNCGPHPTQGDHDLNKLEVH